MLKAIARFYRPPSQWRAASRILGTLWALSAMSIGLTERNVTGFLFFGTLSVGAIGLGVLANDRINKLALVSLITITLPVGVYLVLTYEETP